MSANVTPLVHGGNVCIWNSNRSDYEWARCAATRVPKPFHWVWTDWQAFKFMLHPSSSNAEPLSYLGLVYGLHSLHWLPQTGRLNQLTHHHGPNWISVLYLMVSGLTQTFSATVRAAVTLTSLHHKPTCFLCNVLQYMFRGRRDPLGSCILFGSCSCICCMDWLSLEINRVSLLAWPGLAWLGWE